MPQQLNQDQQDYQTYRIPLVGTEFARMISNASGSTSASGIVGIGVVGVMIVGYLVASNKDQRLVNAVPEKIVNPFTNSTTFYINKRPGFAVLNTPSAGNIGTAIHVWSGVGTDVITAFGATNSTIYTGTSSIGTTTGRVRFFGETLIGTTPNLLASTESDNTAYYYPQGGALTKITDVDFPANVVGEVLTGPPVCLDGYVFWMTVSGKIYNSDLNSVSSYVGDYITCNMDPDQGIGLFRYKDQIGAFSKSTTEFFQDVGNATGSPLQHTQQGFIKIGCVNSKAFCQVDDTVAFIGTTDQSTIGLYMFEGLQPRKYSTPTIEGLLSMSNPASMTLNCVKLVGKTLVIISSTSDARTYVYAVEDNMWHEWSSSTILWESMHGIASGTKYIYSVTSQNTGGKVYVINPTNFVFQDDSVNYTFMIQTSKVDLGNRRRKYCFQLALVGDQQVSTTPIDVTWSDDDYQTWHTTRSLDMVNSDPNLPNLGSFRRRAFKFVNSSNGPLRLEAVELALGQGYV